MRKWMPKTAGTAINSTTKEMGNALRERQADAQSKMDAGIKLSRAERRAWERMIRKRKGGER